MDLLTKKIELDKNLPRPVFVSPAQTPIDRVIQAAKLLPFPVLVGLRDEGDEVLMPEQIFIGVTLLDGDVKRYIAIYNIHPWGWVIEENTNGFPVHGTLHTHTKPIFRNYEDLFSHVSAKKYVQFPEENLRVLLSKNIILEVVYQRIHNISVTIGQDKRTQLFSSKKGDKWFQKQSNSIKRNINNEQYRKNKRNKIVAAAKKEKRNVQITTLQALNKSKLPNNMKRDILRRAKVNMT